MLEFHSSYSRCGGNCYYCGGTTIKYGYTKGKNPRYKCKSCNRTKVYLYRYQAYQKNLNKSIIILTKEGLGIRSTARVLRISPTTLIRRLLSIAENIDLPTISKNKNYEVDELCTFIKNKRNLIWIAYALERERKKVVTFSVGNRTNKTLSKIITTLKYSTPQNIYTDNLKQYKTLIPKTMHKYTRYSTNLIERSNLSLRTHLKRLTRRSICFSKSLKVLSAVLKIYFWS